jgi:hypothetical protein
MSRIRPECLDLNPSDRSVAANVLLRQEPEEDAEDEEGYGDGKEHGDDDDEEEEDDGYSE